MGAVVDWGIVVRFMAEAFGVFLVLAGLTVVGVAAVLAAVRCRRYWREHPNYVGQHWQPRPRRRAR